MKYGYLTKVYVFPTVKKKSSSDNNLTWNSEDGYNLFHNKQQLFLQAQNAKFIQYIKFEN